MPTWQLMHVPPSNAAVSNDAGFSPSLWPVALAVRGPCLKAASLPWGFGGVGCASSNHGFTFVPAPLGRKTRTNMKTRKRIETNFARVRPLIPFLLQLHTQRLMTVRDNNPFARRSQHDSNTN